MYIYGIVLFVMFTYLRVTYITMTYRLESQGRGYEQPDTVPGNPAPTNRRQQRGVNRYNV